MEQISYYEELFESKDKIDVFKINIDFIKDLIDTKAQIEKNQSPSIGYCS